MDVIAVNPFIDAYISSDFFGKLIFIVLFILSVVSWVVLVNKGLLATSVIKSSKSIARQFSEQSKQPLNVNLTVRKIKELPNPFNRLYQVFKQGTIDILNKNQWFLEQRGEKQTFLSTSDIHLLDTQLSISISEELKAMEKHLFLLPMIVSLAPFLGLLGTVWGILLTFGELQAQNQSASNQMVMGGLSMALATTVLGLVVAIPALIAHNYLKNIIKEYETEMETFSQQMLTAVEMQYRSVEVST